MHTSDTRRNNLIGAFCAFCAALCFSFNDMGIKFVSGDYALHQVVLYRSFVGMATFLVIIMPLSGGFKVVKTRRLGMHLLRGLFVVIANSCLFLALSMPSRLLRFIGVDNGGLDPLGTLALLPWSK